MKTVDEFKAGLLEALEKERAAAAKTAEALLRVKEAAESMDPAAHRASLLVAREAFEELTRRASQRNYVATRFAEAVGLKREATVATLITALGQLGQVFKAGYKALSEELDRVRENFSVLALVARYGNAMTASLLAIRGEGHCAVPYGRNGQRTASYARTGRLA